MSDDDWGDDGDDIGEEGDWGEEEQNQGEEWESAEFDDDGVDGGVALDSSDPSTLSPDIQIANIFYEAEDIRREAPQQALDKFRLLCSLAKQAKEEGKQINEESNTNHFQAIQHIVCLLYAINNSHGVVTPSGASDMQSAYRDLLSMIPSVTRNESSEAIDRVLSTIGASRDFNFLLQMYELTLNSLKQMQDTERMRFNVQMKLCKTYMEKGDLEQAQEVLQQLLESCQTETGADDRKNKGGELLEIYALQIQISSKRGDSLKMKELYEKTKDLTAAVKDPRSQSIIRECWGVMFGEEGAWQRSYAEFYSAFSHYQEIGNREKAKQCLKYVVVANLLSGGQSNPFDAREAKVYQSEPDIAVIGQLRAAYEKCDVDAFGSALDSINQQQDAFISQHLDSMILDFHRRAILQTVKSYRRVRLSFLAERLRVPVAKLETLLVQLILDGEIEGKINQQEQVLDLNSRTAGGAKKYEAIDMWTKALTQLTTPAHGLQQFLAY